MLVADKQLYHLVSLYRIVVNNAIYKNNRYFITEIDINMIQVSFAPYNDSFHLIPDRKTLDQESIV